MPWGGIACLRVAWRSHWGHRLVMPLLAEACAAEEKARRSEIRKAFLIRTTAGVQPDEARLSSHPYGSKCITEAGFASGLARFPPRETHRKSCFGPSSCLRSCATPSSREACSASVPRPGFRDENKKLQVGPVSLKECGGHLVLEWNRSRHP